jgi:DNA-binding IclR family transcriptional regulator
VLQTLDRGLALLEWVAAHPNESTVVRAAAGLGISRTTCYHLANTLIHRGFLYKTDGGRLLLGPAIGAIGNVFLQQARPESMLLPVITKLLGRTQETVFLTIWDGERAVCLFSMEGARHLRVSAIAPGFSGFENCRTSGKVILAFLPEDELERWLASHPLVARTPHSITDPEEFRIELAAIRARGWGFDEQEYELGVSGVGAPFFNALGRVAGAIVASVFSGRFDGSLKDSLRAAVLDAAEESSRLVGYRGPYPVKLGARNRSSLNPTSLVTKTSS